MIERRAIELGAKAAYCALWRQYGDGTVHHPDGTRMTPARAWEVTSEPQREMVRLQVEHALHALAKAGVRFTLP